MLHLRMTGGGAPVLYLHGAPSSAEEFRPVVELLGRRHRFLWPDLPGYGLSPRLEGKTSAARVEQLLEDTLLAIGIKELAIVGYSLGAYHALAIATGGRIRVTDLVLLGGYANLDPEEREGIRGFAQMVRPMQSLDVEPLRTLYVERMLAPASATERPERATEVLKGLSATTPAALADELEAAAEARDLLPLLGTLKVRLTARVGALDQAAPPRHSEDIVKRVSGARLQVVAGAGHALWVDDPHRTLEAIDEALR